MSRGPDQLELALTRSTRAKLALIDAAETFRKALDEEARADDALVKLGATPARIELDKVTYAAWQVHRGAAFWDRAPADPIPLKAVE